MERERYGIEVRQVTCVKRAYRFTSNFHNNNSNTQFNNKFARFPVLQQILNPAGHLLVDNCCPTWSLNRAAIKEMARGED